MRGALRSVQGVFAGLAAVWTLGAAALLAFPWWRTDDMSFVTTEPRAWHEVPADVATGLSVVAVLLTLVCVRRGHRGPTGAAALGFSLLATLWAALIWLSDGSDITLTHQSTAAGSAGGVLCASVVIPVFLALNGLVAADSPSWVGRQTSSAESR